jgi:hypothetical protein
VAILERALVFWVEDMVKDSSDEVEKEECSCLGSRTGVLCEGDGGGEEGVARGCFVRFEERLGARIKGYGNIYA